MKKSIVLVAALALLLTALTVPVLAVRPAQAHPSTFPDVLESDVAHDAIEALVSRGVISGTADGLFSPVAPLTRGQVTKILIGWRGVDSTGASGIPFSDVDATYLGYVTTASVLGWVHGYPDGTFRPQAPVTREQMAILVIRSLDLDAKAKTLGESQIESALSKFADQTSVSFEARPYFALAIRYGLYSGQAGRLDPTEVMTRAQVCLVLSRADTVMGALLAGTAPVDTAEGPSADYQDSGAASTGSAGSFSADQEALASFMDEYLFRPHNSPVSGEMVLRNAEWYGIPPLVQLVIMAAETSLGDPELGGTLARRNNFGCMRDHGPDTPWGVLSNGRIWVAGLDWYSFPTPEIGMAAWGRYLKAAVDGFYLSVLTSPEPDWYRFAAVYYGEGVSGFGSYVGRLSTLEQRFRSMAAQHGVIL